MLDPIADRVSDYHYFLVRTLYRSAARFRKRLLIELLKPLGNSIIVLAAFRERIAIWDLITSISAVIIAPTAAIAVGLPAAGVTLVVGFARAKALDGGRRSLRPLAVAVGLVGGHVLWWNLVGTLSFAVTGFVENLGGFGALLGWFGYTAGLLILLPATAVSTMLTVFHAELSAYGTVDATGSLAHTATIVSVAATSTAAAVALGLGVQPLVGAAGWILAISGVTFTHRLHGSSSAEGVVE